MFIATRFHGHAFIDIQNVKSGKKFSCSKVPMRQARKRSSGERDGSPIDNFVVPLGVHNERCLICDFGGLDSGRQTLPERKP